jgi:hypothetical protein
MNFSEVSSNPIFGWSGLVAALWGGLRRFIGVPMEE